MYINRRGTISDRSHLLVSAPTLVCLGKEQKYAWNEAVYCTVPTIGSQQQKLVGSFY